MTRVIVFMQSGRCNNPACMQEKEALKQHVAKITSSIVTIEANLTALNNTLKAELAARTIQKNLKEQTAPKRVIEKKTKKKK